MDEKHSGFRTFFDLGYRLTDGEGEDFRQGYLNFKTEKLKSLLSSTNAPFHFTLICFFSLLLSVLVFSWNRLVLHEPEDARSTGSGAGNFADVHRGSDPSGSQYSKDEIGIFGK